MKFAIPVITAIALLSSGCATSHATDALSTEDKQPQMRIGFVAEKCPVSKAHPESFLAAVAIGLVADVASKVITNSVNALADSLSKEKAISFTDNTRINGFAQVDSSGVVSANKSEACLIVVIGKEFNSELEDTLPNKMPSFIGDKDYIGANSDIHAATGLSGPALMYLEARIVFNAEKSKTTPRTVFAFEPVYWYYPKFIAPDSWKYASQRDVLLRVELSEPGAKTAFGELNLNWSSVESGKIAPGDVIKRKLPWAPIPDGLSEAVKQIDLKKIGPKEQLTILPVNVSAIFTETAKPHVLLQYVGEALKGQSAAIATAGQDAVAQALSQQARITARQTALADVEKKYTDYSEAYSAAVTAYDKVQGAKQGTAARASALTLAKLAYRKVDITASVAKAVYSSAGAGSFVDMPALTPLPEA